MDRMQVCGTCDSGSIPGGSTKQKQPIRAVFVYCAEEGRFELPVPCGTAHFKCAGINHYPTPPCDSTLSFLFQIVKCAETKVVSRVAIWA